MNPVKRSGIPLVRLPAALRLAAVAAWGAYAAFAAEPLTLEAALDAALRHNLRLAESELDARRSEVDVDMARSARDARIIPFVSLSDPEGSRSWAYGLQVVKPLPFGTTIGIQAMGTDGADSFQQAGALSVDITQPLFRRFGRLVADEPIHASGDRLRASLRRWETRKADLALTLVFLFETVVRMDAQMEFEERFIERLDRLAALTRARERQGRATRADTLRVDIRRGEAEARRTNAKERRAIAARELAETIGADPREDLRLTAPPALDLAPFDPETAVAIALARRMDYAQTLDDARSTARRASIAHRNRWPDVSLSLGLRRTAAGTPADAARDGDNHWLATVSSDGLTGRRADRLAVDRSDLDEQSARLAIEWTRQSLVRDVLQAIAEQRRAAGDLRIAERNRDLAEHGARVSRRLYATGRIDGLSAENAESQLAESENRLFEARSSDRIARYALLHALGILIEHPDSLAPDLEGLTEP